MTFFNNIAEPFFLLRTTTHNKIHHFEYGGDKGFIIRKIRGKKCQTLKVLMLEFGAALPFFDGFGENWDALRELLCYMDEWLPGEGYIIVITSPIELLDKETEDTFQMLIKILAQVGQWWSKPIIDNDQFNRPARPFKVVFEMDIPTAEFMKKRIQRYGNQVEII